MDRRTPISKLVTFLWMWDLKSKRYGSESNQQKFYVNDKDCHHNGHQKPQYRTTDTTTKEYSLQRIMIHPKTKTSLPELEK